MMLKRLSQLSDMQAGMHLQAQDPITPVQLCRGLEALPSPPKHLLYPRDRASHDVKALGSIPTGRTDSTAIASDATEYTLRQLQPATKYEIGVKSVRGREESEVASITVHTGGKELLMRSSN